MILENFNIWKYFEFFNFLKFHIYLIMSDFWLGSRLLSSKFFLPLQLCYYNSPLPNPL
jgi:hypothetical protein